MAFVEFQSGLDYGWCRAVSYAFPPFWIDFWFVSRERRYFINRLGEFRNGAAEGCELLVVFWRCADDRRDVARRCRNQNWSDDGVIARLVEVLQIKTVVGDLIECG